MAKRFVKYRKVRADGFASRGNQVSFGFIALKACDNGKITKSQIESARVVINRHCERKGKLIVRKNIFFPVSKKPLEVRMGGGKGAIDTMVSRVKKGSILFELDNLPIDVAEQSLIKASYKLNIPCKIVKRRFAIIEN